MTLENSILESYDPKVYATYRKTRKRWYLRYVLPSDQLTELSMSLPKEVKTEKQAKRYCKAKRDKLIRGDFSEKEKEKIFASSQYKNYSLLEGIEAYLSLPIGKRSKVIRTERAVLVKLFEFLEKEKGLTHLKAIKESHLIGLRTHLLALAARREEAKEKLRRISKDHLSEKQKRQLEIDVKKVGISYATAKSYFKVVKSLFSRLKEHDKIAHDPAKKISPPEIAKRFKAKNKTFTIEQVLQIEATDYTSPSGFPIKKFFFFLLETGMRKGEALHTEWPDIVGEVLKVQGKEDCPTNEGMGWFPKTEDERDINLTLRALRILESLDKRPSVGLIKGEVDEKGDKIPFKAQFVWTMNDKKYGRRRVDDIRGSWKGLLKAAGIPHYGFDKLNPHDMRRLKNQLEEHLRGTSREDRARELGHGTKVNQAHYSVGEGINSEIVQLRQRIESLNSQILILDAENKQLKKENSEFKNGRHLDLVLAN